MVESSLETRLSREHGFDVPFAVERHSRRRSRLPPADRAACASSGPVRLLLDAGADPNQLTSDGDVLTQMAKDRRYEAIAAILEAARARGTRTKPS
jgi:hypothetical protein